MPSEVTIPAHLAPAVSEALREIAPALAMLDANPIAFEGWDAKAARYLARAKKRAAIERWVAAVPYSMRQFDLGRPEYHASRSICGQILAYEYQPSGLLLSGPSGQGKTRLMWQVMKSLAKAGKYSRYWHASEFFSELQGNIRFGNDDAAGWVKAVANVPVVFIDDFGQEALQNSRSGWCRDWFFRFLDIRSNAGLPLFLTTNLSAADMAERSSNIQAHPFLRRLLMVCKPYKISA